MAVELKSFRVVMTIDLEVWNRRVCDFDASKETDTVLWKDGKIGTVFRFELKNLSKMLPVVYI